MSFNPLNHPWGAWKIRDDHQAVVREYSFESFLKALEFLSLIHI